jgi:glycosyltransferase involved in cell wall biosynthesis
LTTLWQGKIGLQHADHVLCLNFEDHDYLVQRLNRRSDSVTRIFPGADVIYACAAKARSYLSAWKLLFAGTWRKNKGIEDLVPAFCQLAAMHPELTLTVLGPGVSEATVKSAFPGPLRSRISCVQTANEADNAVEFANGDIYLLPSLFEGTPLTLIEAMMSGLPIVTTSTCGMKDVVEDGRNGLLVPIRSPSSIVSAVERLVNDAALRARLGSTGRADALRQYRWEYVAKPVREIYDRLCERRIT